MDSKYLIVGQGLAGTFIAHQMVQRNLTFKVISNPDLSCASRVAAGIINPITGRKFVKTWMYEELHSEFIQAYASLEQLLGYQYLKKRSILRVIPSIADENNWDAKQLRSEMQAYMHSNADIKEYKSVTHARNAYGRVKGYQVNLANLVPDFAEYLKNGNRYIEETFDFGALKFQNDTVQYKGLEYQNVIFCEGHLVSQNPYFKNLPFSPAKGELLLIKCPDLRTERIFKDQLFILPLENDLFWVGASYAWEEFSDSPTKEKRKWLIESLEKVLSVSYEIVEHLAGVRPATKFRRPLMGTHPQYGQLHVFNGLGTKGSSLAPYWSKHFVNYLENGVALDPVVDIKGK